MTPVLRLSDLHVGIHGHDLVTGVSLEVGPGESVALLGHSGSGKSLTTAAIVGHLAPQLDATGELWIDGQRMALQSVACPAGAVACVQQDSARALNPLVRVGRQLEVPLRHRGLSADDAARRATRLLEGCGIEEPARVLHSYPAELSGGQRQRVCIALALACEAKLLIADEPTTALDVVSQAQVIEILRTVREEERNRGMALLFITHDIAVASQVCDRAIVLHDGQVVDRGTFRELVDTPRHAYTRTLAENVRRAPGATPLTGAGDATEVAA